MNIQTSLACLLALLFALPASAAPTKLAQQGRVLDGEGEPLEGNHSMLFVLYDAATDGTALWTEERIGDFEAGACPALMATLSMSAATTSCFSKERVRRGTRISVAEVLG